jgi:CDP-diacylglycerol--serine O-phosphatidyltransferase
MQLTRHLPNALTCGNLLCGCLGIISIAQNEPIPPAYFVWAAGAFDFFDGFAARWLKVSSPIGKELDSLADMVSFGVLPGFAMYSMMRSVETEGFWPYIALLLVVFSALRLAKFNIDERQTDSFIGVPTPANAFFITALPFLSGAFPVLLNNIYFLTAITLLFSFLLVAPFELLALKFKHFRWEGNQLRFVFLFISIALIGWLGAGGLVPVILLYILLSLSSRLMATSTESK